MEVESYFNWINERHKIYIQRVEGLPPPWTDDPILQEYKFTNPFRENDRVTIWLRQNWTDVHNNASHSEIIFNCCLFRMIGTSEFAEDHGWVYEDLGWSPVRTKEVLEKRLAKGLRTFTGAYIISNQGITAKKSEVVVDNFLKPIWENKEKMAEVATQTNSLQKTHEEMGKYRGWGGGGFMSYEVVSDLNYTPVLDKAEDRFSWANAGPGAKRGLNRIFDRPLKKALPQEIANVEMRQMLKLASDYLKSWVPIEQVDMRCIEHSLCEWDKYERVRRNQGRPRSKFTYTETEVPEGSVI